MDSLTFSATLFKANFDQDGEAKVSFCVPLRDAAVITKLVEGSIQKNLRVTVSVE